MDYPDDVTGRQSKGTYRTGLHTAFSRPVRRNTVRRADQNVHLYRFMFRRRRNPDHVRYFDVVGNRCAEPRYDDSKRESYSWRNVGRPSPSISKTRSRSSRLIRKSGIVKESGEGDVPLPRLMQTRL